MRERERERGRKKHRETNERDRDRRTQREKRRQTEGKTVELFTLLPEFAQFFFMFPENSFSFFDGLLGPVAEAFVRGPFSVGCPSSVY